jgi:hypothetical protein
MASTLLCIFVSCVMSLFSSPAVLAQQNFELKRLSPDFVGEPGCPVVAVGARTELEVDGFGAPIAARHYVDYRNVGNRPIAAVKFRIGYIDDAGKIRGTFHAPDSRMVEPGGQASQKWRGEKVDPRTSGIKMRVLQVKFSDGELWESVKAREVANPQASGGGNPGFQPMSTSGDDLLGGGTPSRGGRSVGGGSGSIGGGEPPMTESRPEDVSRPEKVAAPPSDAPVSAPPKTSRRKQRDLPADPTAAFDSLLGGDAGSSAPSKSKPAEMPQSSLPPGAVASPDGSLVKLPSKRPADAEAPASAPDKTASEPAPAKRAKKSGSAPADPSAAFDALLGNPSSSKSVRPASEPVAPVAAPAAAAPEPPASDNAAGGASEGAGAPSDGAGNAAAGGGVDEFAQP